MSVEVLIRWPKQGQNLLVKRLESEGDRRHLLQPMDMQEFDAFKALEDPPHRRSVCGVVELIGNRLARLGQARAETLLGQSVHQQAQDHNQTERHDPLGFGR